MYKVFCYTIKQFKHSKYHFMMGFMKGLERGGEMGLILNFEC